MSMHSRYMVLDSMTFSMSSPDVKGWEVTVKYVADQPFYVFLYNSEGEEFKVHLDILKDICNIIPSPGDDI